MKYVEMAISRRARRKNQSIIEYVLLFAAIILVILYGANKVMAPKAKEQMNMAGKIMAKAAVDVSALPWGGGSDEGGDISSNDIYGEWVNYNSPTVGFVEDTCDGDCYTAYTCSEGEVKKCWDVTALNYGIDYHFYQERRVRCGGAE